MACVLVLSLLAGCAGELERPERFALGGPCDDPLAFVHESCTDNAAGCHVPGNQLGTVDLLSPGIAERLLDKPPGLACEGQVLIDSNDPTASFILDKLKPMPRCGGQMPFFRAPLSERNVACVKAFVDQVVDGTIETDASVEPSADASVDAARDTATP